MRDHTVEATDGVCTVVGRAAGLLRGDVLLEDEVLRGGSVVLDADGDILCAACDCTDEVGELALTQIDCEQGVISPGLVNPHDHIGYTEGWPIDTGTRRYDHRHGWRGSLSTPQNSDGTNGRRLGELRQVIAGATSMVGSGYQDGMVRNLDRSSGLEGLDADTVNNQTFPLGDSNETFRSNCGWNFRDSEQEIAESPPTFPTSQRESTTTPQRSSTARAVRMAWPRTSPKPTSPTSTRSVCRPRTTT